MLVHELIYQGESDRIIFGGKLKITYGQLQDQVARFGEFFAAQGICPGDNVGLLAKNSPEFVYSYMAIVSLGAVVVPLNFQLVPREIAYIVKDAGIRTLVTMNRLRLAGELIDLGYNEPVRQLVIPEFLPHLPDLKDSAAALARKAAVREGDLCAIIYTSGTTGNPKGAMLSHKNLVSNAIEITHTLPAGPDDVFLCVLPMYHCFAWTCAVLGTMAYRGAIVIADTLGKEIVKTIRDHGVSVVYAVPTIYNYLLGWGEADDFKNVRFFISGGSALPLPLAENFYRKFNKRIIQGYGLSEASPVVSFNPVDKVKPESIGKPMAGISLRIVDAAGNDVPVGQCGELLVSGPNVMLGYYNLPEETAKALRDGWLYTGDIACRDEEGYYYIKDRLKDMIITSGENVYPREVEEALLAHPAVLEAAVVGVADRIRGQDVYAFLVLKEGHALDAKSLREFLQDKIAVYKIPKVFAQMDALPKNATGKVVKSVLRDTADEIIAGGQL